MFQLLSQPTLSHYTYILINPTTKKPFYVGKGTGTRYQDHFSEAITGKTHNKHKINTIKTILRSGHDVLIDIVFESEEESLCLAKEIEFIKQHGRKSNKTGILTNLTDGGEGGSFPHTEEHKHKLRNHNPGGIVTSKPIYQIDTNGAVVKQWKSSRQAGFGLGIKSWRNISQAANKYKGRLVGNFYWRWVGDVSVVGNKLLLTETLNKNRTQPHQHKIVTQLTLDGNVLYTWKSMSEAAKSLNISTSAISLSIKRNRPCAGFIWKTTSF